MTLILLSLFASFSTFAEKAMDLPECASAKTACANFKAGDHKKNGHGFWVDCVGKIAKGKTVEGVSGLTQADALNCVKAAKTFRDAHKKK
jgi:hypothetical protein